MRRKRCDTGKMNVCGIDETGRGPVLGPMVIGCVVLNEDGRKKLRALNVRDSKKVPHQRRVELEPQIKEIAVEWKLVKVQAHEIDYMRKKISLNQIEAVKMAELITSLGCKPKKVIVDAADPVAENFKLRIIKCLRELGAEIPEIVSEHKADDNYIEVSAASIIAKVERDRDIDILRKEHGEIGSGYLSDEVTQRFIKNLKREGKEMPHYLRKSWDITVISQTRLGEY